MNVLIVRVSVAATALTLTPGEIPPIVNSQPVTPTFSPIVSQTTFPIILPSTTISPVCPAQIMFVNCKSGTTSHPFVTISPELNSSSPSKTTIATIVGSVVGAVVLVGICLYAWYKIKTRRPKPDPETSLNQSSMSQRLPIGETPSATDRAIMEQTGETDEGFFEEPEDENQGGMEQFGVADDDSLEATDRGGMEQSGDDPGSVPLRYPDEIFE